MNETKILLISLLLIVCLSYRYFLNVSKLIIKQHEDSVREEMEEISNIYKLNNTYVKNISKYLIYQAYFNHIKVEMIKIKYNNVIIDEIIKIKYKIEQRIKLLKYKRTKNIKLSQKRNIKELLMKSIFELEKDIKYRSYTISCKKNI